MSENHPAYENAIKAMQEIADRRDNRRAIVSTLPTFTTTNHQNEPAGLKQREARALGLAYAVVGKLIAEGIISLDYRDKDWPEFLQRCTDNVAYVLVDYED